MNLLCICICNLWGELIVGEMYYYIFYRELIICGDFGTGGFYFRGMDGYLLSSGFYHPCGLFLPVCALVLCLWFQSFHLCLTFTYIHIYFDFSNFASSNFLFIYVFIDFLHIFTCFFYVSNPYYDVTMKPRQKRTNRDINKSKIHTYKYLRIYNRIYVLYLYILIYFVIIYIGYVP